jgi:ADP-ribosyl-[dinitrogen reductase] hydrolase
LTKKEIVKRGLEKAESEAVREVFISAKKQKERNVITNKGWVLHALYCAIYGFLHFDTYTDALRWIVDLRGDTDTNGAITGALIGSYVGFSGLMETEKDNIDVLVSCTTREIGNKPRPEVYMVHSMEKVNRMVAGLIRVAGFRVSGLAEKV